MSTGPNIGVLRALGFPAATVQRAFLTESSFVALEGIVLGTVLSTLTLLARQASRIRPAVALRLE